MDIQKITINLEQEGLRLDVLLSLFVSSRCVAEKLIKQSLVKKQMDHKELIINKPSYRVKEGETYFFNLPKKKQAEELLYYDYAIPIVYEDEHLLIVNKPAGIVVHPGPGHEQDTLVNALIKKINFTHNTKALNPGVLRPGIVHRLDKDVSGLMIVSKTQESQDLLINQFKLKKVKRVYRALVLGEVYEKENNIISFIGRHPRDRKRFHSFTEEIKGSKKAITYYKVLESFDNKIHHIECQLETGRTHQIRVHLTSVGLPILGDNIYYPRRKQMRFINSLDFTFKKNTLSFKYMTLYSAFLQFIHPISKKSMEFYLDWPSEFEYLIDQLDFKKKFSV